MFLSKAFLSQGLYLGPSHNRLHKSPPTQRFIPVRWLSPWGPGAFSVHQGCKYPQMFSSLDLSRVLSALLLSPYELVREISLYYLTLRPVFLVALTPGHKPTQVHALSSLPSMWHMSQMDLFPTVSFPEFLANSQSPGDPSPVVHI